MASKIKQFFQGLLVYLSLSFLPSAAVACYADGQNNLPSTAFDSPLHRPDALMSVFPCYPAYASGAPNGFGFASSLNSQAAFAIWARHERLDGGTFTIVVPSQKELGIGRSDATTERTIIGQISFRGNNVEFIDHEGNKTTSIMKEVSVLSSGDRTSVRCFTLNTRKLRMKNRFGSQNCVGVSWFFHRHLSPPTMFSIGELHINKRRIVSVELAYAFPVSMSEYLERFGAPKEHRLRLSNVDTMRAKIIRDLADNKWFPYGKDLNDQILTSLYYISYHDAYSTLCETGSASVPFSIQMTRYVGTEYSFMKRTNYFERYIAGTTMVRQPFVERYSNAFHGFIGRLLRMEASVVERSDVGIVRALSNFAMEQASMESAHRNLIEEVGCQSKELVSYESILDRAYSSRVD